MNTTPETLPYLEDILLETRTRRADWLAGSKEIAAYTGLDYRDVNIHYLPTGKMREAIKVNALFPGRASYTYVLKKSDAEKYRKPAPAPVTASAANGHSAPLAQTVVLKEGSPLMSQQDSKELKLALWNQKDAADKLKTAIDTLTEAVKQMTAKL